MSKIVVVGSFNMDLVVRLPVIPRPGETLLGGVFATHPGGKGSNQAVAAARLGGAVTMIGRVGADAFGDQLLAMAGAEGIDARFVGIDPEAATGVALIQVDDQGQNSIAVASGANFRLTAADVAAALAQIDAFDLLVMPLETPLETIVTAAGLARQVGARVVLNPAPAQHLTPELLGNVDVLIPNEYEAALMTGIEIHSLQDAHRAAARLLQSGPGSVIITLGSRGALIAESTPADQPHYTHVPAFSVKPVDTTAAGDAFIGGLAVALGEGHTLPASAAFASAAAALAVTRVGAQPSLPSRAEVDEFLATRPSP
ncbi:MAG: ribokinase [Anaerolinea sp.]|nr:ribokinase [Anaerolinea sp.]